MPGDISARRCGFTVSKAIFSYPKPICTRESGEGLVSSLADAVAADGDGVIITIDVSAGSKKTRFPAGYNEWRKAVNCQIAAPPVEGKANKAILNCIAAQLGVGRGDVALVSGATSSLKRVFISGISRDEVIDRLTSMLDHS
jgi:uncharacterized protein (TIGR00251 family)